MQILRIPLKLLTVSLYPLFLNLKRMILYIAGKSLNLSRGKMLLKVWCTLKSNTLMDT